MNARLFTLMAASLSCGLACQVRVVIDTAGGPATTVVRTPSRSVSQPQAIGIGITNGRFDQGLAGWSTAQVGGTSGPGTVSIVQGEAQLAEGDSFLVTLAQEFQLPYNATKLTFDVRLVPGFDRAASGIPDAFEVHLLDQNLRSVVPTWHPRATSFFNVQEDGSVYLGVGTSYSSGLVTVDLGRVAALTQVTIFVDQIGADADMGSGVRVDNFALDRVCGAMAPYGVGLAGSGALIPLLSGSGCPARLEPISIDVSKGLGGAKGCFFAGTSADNTPIFGGTNLVSPILIELRHELDGANGVPGVGTYSLPLTIPDDPSLVGRDTYFQAMYMDPVTPFGISMSNGLRIRVL